MKKNRKKQIVVLCIALVCIFILVFSLSHKSATKGSANPPLTDVLTDSISQIVSACPGEIGVAVIINNTDTVSVNANSTSKCKITKCFCKSTPLVLRNSIFFLVSH